MYLEKLKHFSITVLPPSPPSQPTSLLAFYALSVKYIFFMWSMVECTHRLSFYSNENLGLLCI